MVRLPSCDPADSLRRTMSTEDGESGPLNGGDHEIVCPGCGARNSPHAGWCARCDTPLPCSDESVEPEPDEEPPPVVLQPRGSGTLALVALWLVLTPMVIIFAVLCAGQTGMAAIEARY